MLEKSVLVLLTSTAILGVGAFQSLAQMDKIRSLLPQLQRETEVRIFLPKELPSQWQSSIEVYANAEGDEDGYEIHLGSHPKCQGETACFMGYLGAETGNFSGGRNFEQVPLSRGITGYYMDHPRRISIIKWNYDGVNYTIQLKTDKESVISTANSAIESTLADDEVSE
jgi:hypothetical protein